MSSHPLPPNPCLVAVILVVKIKSESRMVFHYPPHPGEDNTRFRDIFKELDNDTSSTSSEDGGESSAEEAPVEEISESNGRKSNNPPDETFAGSPEKSGAVGEALGESRWNNLFGYRSGVLAKALCPASTYHKKRFEMELGNNVYLGSPVFAGSDGNWKRKNRIRRSSSKSYTMDRLSISRDDIKSPNVRSPSPVTKLNGEISEQSTEDDGKESEGPLSASGAEENEHVEEDQPLEKQKRPSGSMSMFHVVFVLNPPPLEYQVRTRDMYDNVVRRFSRALRWEQARSNLVAKETSIITSIMKRANTPSEEMPHLQLKTLYQDLVTHSTLARGLSTLFDSISGSRIAHLNLTPALSLSLQIPTPRSISSIPTPLSPQLPGLWLTTAASFPADDDVQTTGSHLGSHFTLLLLSDLHTILADIKGTASPLTGALTHYLRVSKPTKSFHQISQSSRIPLSDIQFLASHLIYWRRAQAIPPLHQRDTYVVSPNADMRDLVSATSSFAKAFPTLPSLPKILGMLSSRPRQYASLIPSRDHKEAYLNILAWLLRHGWVTQLRSFAWVRVPPHIKEAVDKKSSVDGGFVHKFSQHTDSHNDANDTPQPEIPRFLATSPASSTNTAFPIYPPSSSLYASIIPNPRLASAPKSRYLASIATFIRQQQGEETKAAWDKCVRYFDGKHAIETIPITEGWKKKRVSELVASWEVLGVLVRGRHW